MKQMPQQQQQQQQKRLSQRLGTERKLLPIDHHH
jgi:hypothetical protein